FSRDWSSDVCSSDLIVVFFGMLVAVFLTLLAVPTVYALLARRTRSPQHVSRLVDRMMGARDDGAAGVGGGPAGAHAVRAPESRQIGRASCRERGGTW